MKILSSVSLKALYALSSAALIGAMLAGCSTAPLSFLNDGQVYYKVAKDRYPLRVVAVDGDYSFQSPLPIAPGVHEVKMAAAPVAGFRLPVEKTFTMTVDACTRYYLAAQRRSRLIQDWDLVVEVQEPVAGCDPVKEMSKVAGRPAASSTIVSGQAG